MEKQINTMGGKMNRNRILLIMVIVYSILTIIYMVIYTNQNLSGLLTYFDYIPKTIFMVIFGLVGFIIYPILFSIILLVIGIKNKVLQYKYLSIIGLVIVLLSYTTLNIKPITKVIPSSIYTLLKHIEYSPILYTLILSIILLVQLGGAPVSGTKIDF
jgi:hypothetical protein